MSGSQPHAVQTRHAGVKPPPIGPTPPAPSTAPPVPPNVASAANITSTNRQANGAAVNGTHAPKGKKKNPDPPVDPSQLYESLKNRIATLEEDMIHNEEEGRRIRQSRSRIVTSVQSTN